MATVGNLLPAGHVDAHVNQQQPTGWNPDRISGPASAGPGTGSVVLTIVLTLVSGFIAFVLSLFAALGGMATDSCFPESTKRVCQVNLDIAIPSLWLCLGVAWLVSMMFMARSRTAGRIALWFLGGLLGMALAVGAFLLYVGG